MLNEVHLLIFNSECRKHKNILCNTLYSFKYCLFFSYKNINLLESEKLFLFLSFHWRVHCFYHSLVSSVSQLGIQYLLSAKC